MWFDWGDCTMCVDEIRSGELLLCVMMYYEMAGMACGESSDSIVEKCYIELVFILIWILNWLSWWCWFWNGFHVNIDIGFTFLMIWIWDWLFYWFWYWISFHIDIDIVMIFPVDSGNLRFKRFMGIVLWFYSCDWFVKFGDLIWLILWFIIVIDSELRRFMRFGFIVLLLQIVNLKVLMVFLLSWLISNWNWRVSWNVLLVDLWSKDLKSFMIWIWNFDRTWFLQSSKFYKESFLSNGMGSCWR